MERQKIDTKKSLRFDLILIASLLIISALAIGVMLLLREEGGYVTVEIAGDKVGELVESISRIKTMGFGYKELALDMNIDYPRAEFYNKMFEKWGLETGAQWKIGER